MTGEKESNMIIQPYWLSVLVGKAENKVTSTKQTKYDSAATRLIELALLCY